MASEQPPPAGNLADITFDDTHAGIVIPPGRFEWSQVMARIRELRGVPKSTSNLVGCPIYLSEGTELWRVQRPHQQVLFTMKAA